MKILMKILMALTLLITSNFVVAEYVRDSVQSIVFDTATKLLWQDMSIHTTVNWESAILNCENYSGGDYTDWRLPNINELITIADYTERNPAISDNSFQTGLNADFYWSSTSNAEFTDQAWVISFMSGGIQYREKANAFELSVRCVRGGL